MFHFQLRGSPPLPSAQFKHIVDSGTVRWVFENQNRTL